MSNDIIDYNQAYAELAAKTKDSLTALTGNFISTLDKVFTLPDGTTRSTLECIVLDYIRINTLMPKPYVPNTHVTALCWAINSVETELAPSTRVPHPKANTCAECPNNVFVNGQSKVCANTYRLALIPPDATETSVIWLLKVSPTALKAWTRYVKTLEMTLGAAGFAKVITKIGFNPAKSFPSLTFTALTAHERPEIVYALHNLAAQELLIEPNT